MRRPRLVGWAPSTSFCGVDLRQDRLLVDVIGQGELDDLAVPRRIGVDLSHDADDLLLRGGRRQTKDFAAHDERGGVLHLAANVRRRRRKVADEYDGEARHDALRGERLDACPQLAQDVVGDRFAIDNLRGHGDGSIRGSRVEGQGRGYRAWKAT